MATTVAGSDPQAIRIGPLGLIAIGAAAGLAGGLLFGMIMASQGMLPMVAALVGGEAEALGFAVHLAISAGAGAALGLAVAIVPALVASPLVAGAGGAVYGVALWIAGALIAMPMMLGMNEMVLVIGDAQVISLIGHLVFGITTGLVLYALARRLARS
jgi:hypothetical protein